MEKSTLHGRAIFGIILVLFGLAMMARSFEIFTPEVEFIVFSWPMLLVVLGLIFLITANRNTTGFILLLLGLVFLLPRIFDIPYSLHDIFWPVVFIVIGILIVVKALGSSRRKKDGITMDEIDDVAIFGGNERRVTSQEFKGGKVTSIFGGSQLNFTEAELAEGEVTIDLFTLFGGSTMIIPKDWEVKVEVISILGGFADKRIFAETKTEQKGTLVIKGMAIFGGGEIKSV
jgi:predicted membrane protein